MSELDRARAHLRYCQDALATFRRNGCRYLVPGTEECVLAALSWVWEEQEKVSGGIRVGDVLTIAGDRRIYRVVSTN